MSRFSKCLIRTKLSDDEIPVIILPKGRFEFFDNDQKIIATMREDDDKIGLYPVPKNVVKIYEIYIELKKDGALWDFMIKLKDLITRTKSIVLLDPVDQICEGSKDNPCSFDAFYGLVEGYEEDNFEKFLQLISHLKIENDDGIEMDVIHKVITEEVK